MSIGLSPISSSPIPQSFGIATTGLSEVIFDFDGTLFTAEVGLTALSSAIFDFDNAASSFEAGVVLVTLPTLIDISATSVMNVGVTSSSLVSFDLSLDNAVVYLGSRGSAYMDLFCEANSNFAGASATSYAGFELEDIPSSAILAGVMTSVAEFEFFFSAFGYTTEEIASVDLATFDVLNAPIVAYCMNVKTKGVTAYTDNIDGKVKTLVATPILDFNTKQRKIIPDLYVNMRATDDSIVSLIAGETKQRTEVATINYNDNDGLHIRRAKLPKGITATNFQFFIENSNGSDMQVQSIEPNVALSKRSI